MFGRKYDCFQDWATHEPELLAALRRGATVASAWLRERSLKRFQKLPWLAAIIVDPRQSAETITSVINFIQHAPLEMIDELWTARLRALLALAGETAEALRLGMWNRAVSIFVWLVATSCAPVEFLHGRNKSRVNACGHLGSLRSKVLLGGRQAPACHGHAVFGSRSCKVSPEKDAKADKSAQTLCERFVQ